MLAAFAGGVHLIALLGFAVGMLVILMASAPSISVQDLKAINRVYLMSGTALLVAAVAGGLLWSGIGKPTEFYSNNPVFHAKLGLFILLLATFVYSGFTFKRLQASIQPNGSDAALRDETEASIAVSASVRRLQKTSIPLLIIIPALAWMMARGIGY